MNNTLSPSKRDERQLLVLERWLKAKARGTFQGATGVGKTRVALLAIVRMRQNLPDARVLVTVPFTHLVDAWVKPGGHLDKWNLREANITVITNNAAANRDQWDVDLWIPDEVHRLASPTFSSLWQKVRARWILGLTAKLERLDGKHTVIEQHAPVFDRVSLREALDEGYISSYIVFNLAVPMTRAEQREYDRLTHQMETSFGMFQLDYEDAFQLVKTCGGGKDMGGPEACLRLAARQGWYDGMGDTHTWSPKSIASYAAMWRQAVSKRKKLLYQSESKFRMAVEILQRRHVPTITFGQSTEMADRLTSELPGSVAYHSNLEALALPDGTSLSPKRRREEAITGFQTGVYHTIHTAKALDEGFDVEGIEFALRLAGTSSPTQTIQRTGRAVRFVEGKNAIIVNLYHPGTQDEKWLRSAQNPKDSLPARWINDPNQIPL